jgi:GTP-binding protein
MVSNEGDTVDIRIKSVEFVKSSVKVDQCPTRNIPEYAFIGRSNVGKSSLINMICGRKMIARVSSSPGKTQTINHYTVNDQWFLVDLPGVWFRQNIKKKSR